jgi:multisubunit Na+/H+ antiporter MnhC subunit
MSNLFYTFITILFLTGFWIVLSQPSLVRKIAGLGVMQGSSLLMLLAASFAKGHGVAYPVTLALTAIIATGAVIALALVLVQQLKGFYGTSELDEIQRLRRMDQ